jgi:hypothetical protein
MKKKLKLRDEAKQNLKKMYDILDEQPLSKEQLSKMTAGDEGCGAYCQITCSFYCRPTCTTQCQEFCSNLCDLYCAPGLMYFGGGGGGGASGCIGADVIWQY